MQSHSIEPPVGIVEAVAVPASAVPEEVGVKRIVLPPSIAAVVVIVIIPVAWAIATEAILSVAAGAVKPASNGLPLAAFSATVIWRHLREPVLQRPWLEQCSPGKPEGPRRPEYR